MEQALGLTYDWQNKLVIGQGAHSVVYKVKHRDRDQYYAIKQFKRKNPQSQQSLKNQLECFKKVKHNNVIKLYANSQSDDIAWEILEYCESNLRKYMQVSGQQKQIPEKEAISLIRQIIQGMLELRKYNLMHRDLKPQNILLKQKTIKLCDFGLAAYCSESTTLNNYCGTPPYMSPQVSLQQPYTSKADIWSIGIIFYQLLYSKPPWQILDTTNYKTHIRQNPLKFPSGILLSNCTKTFIQKCLQLEQKDRLNWQGVTNHPLVNLGQKIIVQIQVFQVNQLIQILSDFYAKEPKQLQTKFYDDSYQNSLNLFQFFKKVKRFFYNRQITLRQSRLIFQKMDYNKNGKVALDEFKKILSKLSNSYLTLSSIVQDIKVKDLSTQVYKKANIHPQTNFLNLKQFQSLVKIINPNLSLINIKKVFERLDKDEDMRVAKTQVSQLFQLKQPSFISKLKQPSFTEILFPITMRQNSKSKSKSKSPTAKITRKSPNKLFNKI